MGLYRCQNQHCSTDPHGRLIFDFEAEEPVCPTCGTDARVPGPEVVVALKVVHFDPPSHVFGRGLGHPACRPEKSVRGVAATGDPGSVNCAACKATEAYRKAYRDSRPWDEADYAVEIDAKAGVIRRSE
jgi:hypothetical protein